MIRSIGGYCFVLLCLVSSYPSEAIELTPDYEHDTFIENHTEAKAALEAAFEDISDVITTDLDAITQDRLTGFNGSTSVTYDWGFRYQNPAFSQLEIESAPRLDPNEVKVFVGVRNIITGNTLAAASFGFLELTGGVPEFTSTKPDQFMDELPGAVANAESASEAMFIRSGPPIDAGSGAYTVNGFRFDYSIDNAAAYGSLWFDVDEDNNGNQDPIQSLEDYWHFNHNAPVPQGEIDFYSVALHEALHAIGFGGSAAWDALTDGSNWLGTEVAALVGSGNGLIESGSGHVAAGTMSTGIFSGQTQEALMTPSFGAGMRRELTLLDLAFLRDLGYQTIVPEPPQGVPGDYNGNGIVDAADYGIWLASLGDSGSNLPADGNGDNNVTLADYEYWRARFGNTSGSGSTSVIPEPASIMLLTVLCSLAVGASRWS